MPECTIIAVPGTLRIVIYKFSSLKFKQYFEF